MLITQNSPGQIQHKPASLAAFVRTRFRPSVCFGFAAILALLALFLIIASFRLSYSALREHLLDLYGAQRVSIYFTPAVYTSAMSRLRLAAGAVLLLAAAIAVFRNWLASQLDPIWGALALSFRHARRWKIKWNPSRSVALALIILIAIFVRLKFINQPMRYDESETVLSYALKPFYLGLSIYTEPNNHIFHTLLVHFAILLAGSAEWAVRLPAFIAGVLLCPLAYALAYRLAGPTAALFTAALVATSSILVEFSTNARGYTLLCCAMMVLLIAGYETLRNASPGWFAVFGLAAVIGFWTIPIFLMCFGGALLWMIWESMSRRRRFRHIYWLRLFITTVAAGAATILVYIPPVAANGPQALLRNQWTSPRNFHLFLTGNLAGLHEAWQMWNRDLPVWWPWIMALAFLSCLALFPTLRRLSISLIAWTVFLFTVRRFLPFARNWLVFLPVFLIAACAAFSTIFDRFIPPVRRSMVAIVAAVGLGILLVIPVVRNRSVLSSSETGALKSAQQIDTYLAAKEIPTDRVFRSVISSIPLDYYWWRRTGTQPHFANLQNLRQRDVREGWFILNHAYEERLNTFPVTYRFDNIQVLDTHDFDGASLWHVTWAYRQ